MALLSGAEMIVQFLKDEGVRYVYGYPGGAVLHIYDALFNVPEIEHILVRHEQAATHMADGYARATGKAGVVLVTSGPGATNAITGIATAFMDSIPMVVLSGQVSSCQIGTDAFQETDMIGISRPIVKHSFIVKHASEIPQILKKAFYLAETGRPGPVVVDLPKEVTSPDQKYEYSYPRSGRIRSYNPPKHGHIGQIQRAASLLVNARQPIIYAGGGVVLGRGASTLTELARILNAPVTNTLMGLGGYPGSDRQFVGMLGMHGSYTANMAMHNADVILAVGARFDDRVTNGADKFCPDSTIIHIDVDPVSISKIVKADVPIVGDVRSVLSDLFQCVFELMPRVDGERLGSWWRTIEGWKDGLGLFPYEKGTGGPIKPQEVIEAIYNITNGEAFVTSDVGQHQMFAAQHYLFDKPNRWINSGGLGTMGFGLPAAMGVKLSFPDSEVVCITGDGSIQMNIQELSTCLQFGINVKIINLNNSSLGMVRQLQDINHGSRHSHSYMDSLPDFVAVAEAYSHLGVRITNREQLVGKLEEVFKINDQLVFVDIQVDPEEHVYPMQIKDGSMCEMYLSKTMSTEMF